MLGKSPYAGLISAVVRCFPAWVLWRKRLNTFSRTVACNQSFAAATEDLLAGVKQNAWPGHITKGFLLTHWEGVKVESLKFLPFNLMDWKETNYQCKADLVSEFSKVSQYLFFFSLSTWSSSFYPLWNFGNRAVYLVVLALISLLFHIIRLFACCYLRLERGKCNEVPYCLTSHMS